MNDLLIALLISGGGGFLMAQMDGANATAQQKASCSSQGGTWGTPNPGICNGGQPVNPGAPGSGATEWGAAIDLGVPFLAGALVTRSVGGVAGAVLGAAINFFIGVSQIH